MTLYLALEGSDGSGKSTQATLLVRWLRSQNREVLHLREPGSTPLGDRLREMLLDHRSGELSALAEALLCSAARAEMMRGVVAPALQAGTLVVTERCYLSTSVYQGVAAQDEGVSLSFLKALAEQAQGEVWPDRILVLDVLRGVGCERMAGKSTDRIEARSPDYHERVCAGYADLATRDERCRLIDGSADPERVQQAVQAHVGELLGRG